MFFFAFSMYVLQCMLCVCECSCAVLIQCYFSGQKLSNSGVDPYMSDTCWLSPNGVS